MTKIERGLCWALALGSGASAVIGACGQSFQAAGENAGGSEAAGVAGAMGDAGERDAPGGGGKSAGGAATAGGAAGELSAGGGAGVGSVVVQGYPAAVLGDRPLVYWRMGETKLGSVADETGGGNDLVLQGDGHQLDVAGAIPADGDGAIGFDGIASFAMATDPRALDFPGNAPFTLECWARWSAGGASEFQHLISNLEGIVNDRDGYVLYLLPGNATAQTGFEYDRPAAELGIYGPLPPAATWGYYAAAYDGARVLLYVNGTLADTKATTGSIGKRTGSFTLARASSGNGSFFKGALDEVAIYARALPAADIQRHFLLGK